MKNDASFGERFAVEIIAMSLVLIVGMALLLQHFPLTFSSQDESGAAVMPQQLGQSDVLLILPETQEIAESWTTFDFSFAWYNFLSQSMGAFSIALTGEIVSPPKAQIIVVPQRSAEKMSKVQIEAIAQAVERGATLLIEMPPPSWSALTGVKRRVKVSATIKHLTDAQNSLLPPKWRDHLLNTPLDMQAMRLEMLDAEPLPPQSLLLELDGAIAHYRRSVGTGQVFVLAFNMGQVITAMQQGHPGESFLLETDNDPPTVSDLVMSEKLRRATVPYVDLLKTHIISALAYMAPMPMLWPFPNEHRSALLLTHETGSFDERILALADDEKNQNVRSTWLVTASLIDPKTLKEKHAEQFDMGVAFLRPPMGRIFRKYGFSFFEPVAIESNIVGQKNTVAQRLGSTPSSCKIASSQWPGEYTTTFRYLAYARCQIDLTYAPVEPEEYGYLFGSGFPFLPIERNGLPLPTYELPALISDEADLESIPPDAALKLLTESESTYHEPVRVHFNAEIMRKRPSYLTLKTWIDLLKASQEQHIWTTTVKQFMYHYTLRKQAHLHYTFEQPTKVLNVKATLPDAPFQFTLSLPRKTQYGTLHDVWIDKKALDISETKVTGDGLFALFGVGSGEHLIQAQYQ